MMRIRTTDEAFIFACLFTYFTGMLSAWAVPSWWTNVLTAGSANDWAAVNQGQVKWIASNAYAEMQAKLPGGAGAILAARISGFLNTDNFAAVNAGQLKFLAQPFYDRLIQTGFTNAYPWTSATNDDADFSMANIGQVKRLFDFDFTDSDGDGMPDAWEQKYGLNPTNTFPTNGLVAWWRMDEERGTLIMDSTANTNHGTLSGTTASFGEWGPVGRALQFAGTNDPDGELDSVAVPDRPSLDIQTQITVAAWIYTRTNDSNRKAIFEKLSAYYFNIRDAKPQFYLEGVQSGGNYFAPSAGVLPTNAWAHVAATYSGTNMVIYVNATPVVSQVTNGTIAATSSDLWLGYGSPSRYWQGYLDDLRIYNRALSAGEIRALYEIGNDPDADRLGNLDQWISGGSPTTGDTDADGLSDWLEVTFYGTKPYESNIFAAISGTNSYVGTGTGRIYTIASPTKFGWSTNSSTFRTNSGPFSIINVPVGSSNYWIKAWLDLNGDGKYASSEPASVPLSSTNLVAGGISNISIKSEKIRGMRVDFAFYGDPPFSSLTSTQVVQLIVSNAVEWGVNALFPLAYSWEYGAYWRTPTSLYGHTENIYGSKDILRTLISHAHASDVQVVAWIQPSLCFRNAWLSNASWRALFRNGTNDYDNTASPSRYLLSPFNTNVLNWFDGVVGEILDLGVDGIDISETYLGYGASTSLTYDAAANIAYSNKYPGGTLGDANWRKLRAEVLTSNVYQRVGQMVKARANKSYVVTFSWNENSDGSLWTSAETADSFGFDFNAILDLAQDARPDVFSKEFIWQSKATDNCDTNLVLFGPDWTAKAATTFVVRTRNRTIPIVHPELSPFTKADCDPGTNIVPYTISPTVPQFQTSLFHAFTNSAGADFYSHDLAYVTNAGTALTNVFKGRP